MKLHQSQVSAALEIQSFRERVRNSDRGLEELKTSDDAAFALWSELYWERVGFRGIFRAPVVLRKQNKPLVPVPAEGINTVRDSGICASLVGGSEVQSVYGETRGSKSARFEDKSDLLQL